MGCGDDNKRQLVLLDNRGTGDSAVPADPSAYACDRLVDDVETLRQHLRLERFDLLAHLAAASVGHLYAARHPDHVRGLVLITPGSSVVGIEAAKEQVMVRGMDASRCGA